MKRYMLWLKEQKILKKVLIRKGNILAEIAYSSTVWKRIVMRMLVLNVVNNDIGIDLTELAIHCTHRIRDPKKKRKKTRPIIAKIVRYYDRKKVFSKKKHLEGKGISITERLVSFRMLKLEEAREKYGFNYVWTIDGRNMLKMEMINQAYIMVNWLKHYGKRSHSFVCVIRVVIFFRVIFFWDNFATSFFQSNNKCKYAFNANIFISDFTFYFVFTQSYFFLLQDIPYLQIHTTNYFLLFS